MKHLNKIEEMKNTYVAFGTFDGMHKGHLSVIKELSVRAKQDGVKSVVISRCKAQQAEVLSTEEEKAYYAGQIGVDYLISHEEKEGATDQEFLEEVLKSIGAKLIIIGAGDSELEMITKLAKEKMCAVCTVDEVSYQGEVISNTMLKNYFMDGKFKEVTEMCGHPYVMIGEVVHGKELGRTVGMPTANLGVAANKLKPPSGVYATRTFLEEDSYQGLTNIGKRPSVDDLSTITIETYLLDFSQNIYGKKLIVEVHLYIRGVQKFSNLEEVQKQVQKDISQVKDYLNTLS